MSTECMSLDAKFESEEEYERCGGLIRGAYPAAL